MRDRFALADTPKVAALLALAVVLLAISVGMAFVTIRSVSEDTAMVEHTLGAEAAISRLAALNEQLETGRRGYLLQSTPDFIAVIRTARSDLNAEISTIASLVSDNPRQSRRITEIAALHEERGAILENEILTPATARAVALDAGLSRTRGVIIARRIRALAAEMQQTEEQLLTVRNRAQLESLVRLYVVGGIAALLLLILLGAVIVLVMRYNRQLNSAQDALQLANTGLEDAVAARTTDLTRANQEIQRFAYIVSHDLRSPLVNVLGFTAELDQARQTIRTYLEKIFENHPAIRDEAAWVAVDEDVPEALSFIRTSTQKMDRLINSILELSRQGRRPVRPELLDMDELAGGVIASLHQQTEDAGATMSATPIPQIESDRIAVEQILSNLAENALKYLSPARPGVVSIAGKRQGGMVHIDVIDNGRGIDPADHQRVFDLFRRAGSQDKPGEGIGLANVRALAYRLGGTVEVDSALDQGARFRLSLPAKFIVTEPLA